GDFIEDGEATDAEESVISGFLHDDMRRVLGTLDQREQNVIRLRYGLDNGSPRTLDEIGKQFDLSRERDRQIERAVMAKRRNGERADRLRAYASCVRQRTGRAVQYSGPAGQLSPVKSIAAVNCRWRPCSSAVSDWPTT